MFTLEFPMPTHVRGESKTRKTSEKTSEKILRLVSTNQRITIAELAKTIGVTPRSIERNLKTLQDQGRIKRIGPDKGGHWKIIRKI